VRALLAAPVFKGIRSLRLQHVALARYDRRSLN
jgi:hypothetical protein